MQFIPQISPYGCGFACLKMVLSITFKNEDYLYLHENEDSKVLSFKEIVDEGKKYGLYLDGYKIDDKKDIKDCKIFPFIASYKPGSNIAHAVVVTNICFNRVFISDPEKGKIDLSLKEFISLWDGNLLRVTSSEEINKPEKALNPLTKKDFALMYFLQIFSMSAIIVGLFFINENVKIVFPVAFVALYVISSLLLKAYQISLMKKIDLFFIERIKPQTKRKDFLNRIENYKKNILSNYVSLISDVFLSISIVIISVLNGTKNMFLLIVPILLAFLAAFIFDPILKKKKDKLDQREKDLEDTSDNMTYTKKFEDVHIEAYKNGQLLLFRKIFIIFIIVLNSILLMFVTNTTYLPYIVFYSCLQYALFESLLRIFNFNEKQIESRLWKAKLLNLFSK